MIISISASAARALGVVPVASPNSVAIVDASVAPLENSEWGMSGFDPITIATAIVSPSARPAPNAIAPRMPVRALGNTTLDEHLAPRGAERESTLDQLTRNDGDHVSRDRDDGRQDHDRENESSKQEAESLLWVR